MGSDPMEATKCKCADIIGAVINPTDKWAQVREWMMSISSILVVIVALFPDWIKSWFRTHMAIQISNKKPHLVLECADGSVPRVETDEFVGKLWLEIKNESRWIEGKFLKVAVESIYVKSKGGKEHCFSKRYESHPQCLCLAGKDSSKDSTIPIAPKTSEFAHVITIKKPEKGGMNKIRGANTEDPPSLPEKPILIVETGRQKFMIDEDLQDVIVVVRVSGSSIKTDVVPVFISWRGSNLKHLRDEAEKYLECRRLSDSEFKDYKEES